MSGFKIGNFEFISLSKPPYRPAQQVVVEARAGTDGLSFWRTGKRGKPFTVFSSVNPQNLSTADTLFRGYRDLIGANPVVVSWANLTYPDLLCEVIEVETPDDGIYATAIGIGGVAPQGMVSNAMLHAIWTLIPINIQQ